MALRNQPYIPLYVQDYLTDEKLNMCSASSQGIYIKLMCLFHKSEQYGGILLKQKDKQNSSTTINFAYKLAKLLPFQLQEIQNSLTELIEEGVLESDGDFLYQKRMVRDNEISELRSFSGSKGGKKTQDKIHGSKQKFALAKVKANSEYENENESRNDFITEELIIRDDFEIFRKTFPGKKNGFDTEYQNFRKKNKPEVVKLLLPALYAEIDYRADAKRIGAFVPEWKNLQTWINKKCWLQELPPLTLNQHGPNKKPASRNIDFEGIANAVFAANGM